METAKEAEKVITEIWKETGAMPCKPSGKKCFVFQLLRLGCNFDQTEEKQEKKRKIFLHSLKRKFH